jgi:hypothetical protein
VLINGQWLLCDDGVVRPVIQGKVLTAEGFWQTAEFLVDTAADRTVFSAAIWEALGLEPIVSADQLSGVGGTAATVVVATPIRLTREDGSPVVFRGRYAAFTEPDALDMSVLGRDLTNLLALIVDRPRDVVCLLGQRHTYTIEQR